MVVFTPWQPNPRAVAKVQNPLPPPEQCPYCGFAVLVMHHEDVYGRQYGKWPWVYQCRNCRAMVGMHPYTNIPLGTLADKETQEARKAAKREFVVLYQDGGPLDRSEAYTCLADKLGIPKEECHFAWFDVETCKKAAEAAKQLNQEFHTSLGE